MLEIDSEEVLKLSMLAFDCMNKGSGSLIAPSRTSLFCFQTSFCCLVNVEECCPESFSPIFKAGFVSMALVSSSMSSPGEGGKSMASGGGRSGTGGGGMEGNSSSDESLPMETFSISPLKAEDGSDT